MANDKLVALLTTDVGAWNKWRRENVPDLLALITGVGSSVAPDLRRADLQEANLREADLRKADLREAILLRADLSGANLSEAKLYKVDLSNANLYKVDLSKANLSRADLSGALFHDANLSRAELFKADLLRGNLQGANLHSASLFGVDLSGANLSRANLSGANLRGSASLSGANLSRADLSGADLSGANLSGADLSGADLRKADLFETNLSRANLSRADLSGARLGETVFADSDLAEVKGLDQCAHRGSSIVNYQLLQKSGPLPLVFLRGVGLPENFINYLPSLLNQPIEFYSCFISYSSKDHEFAERLHADLQNKGVRCWFAPHDMPIGAKIWDALDEAIRLRDKVLLILSEGAIASDWVEDEVSKAFAEERERKQVVLFPIRLDDVVRESPEPWACKLRDQRNIGDFTRWKDHDAYRKSFERLVQDLTIKQTHDGSAGREGA